MQLMTWHALLRHTRGMLPQSQVQWGTSEDPIYMHPYFLFPYREIARLSSLSSGFH